MENLDIQITLTEAETRTVLAQYIATKLGSNFSVHPSKIKFELEADTNSVPIGRRFKQITAKAVQTIKPG